MTAALSRPAVERQGRTGGAHFGRMVDTCSREGGIGRAGVMTRDAAEHSDVLVITVWRETDVRHPLRARVTYGLATDDAPATFVTADPGEVIETVRRWLTEISAR